MAAPFPQVIFFDLGETLTTTGRQWMPGAQSQLADIQKRGYRLGILSNTGSLTRGDILRLLPDDFRLADFESDLVLFSSEVGIEKPALELFRRAVQAAAVPAEQCVYCSESEVELKAAREVGLQAWRPDDMPAGDGRATRGVPRPFIHANSTRVGTPMTRFERVVHTLDAAVGGPNAPVGFHGPFWRGISREQFIVKKVFGLPLVVLGDARSSNLIKAMRGDAPFGADLPEADPSSTIRRMPAGMAPVAPADIAFVETWINDGCPEDSLPQDQAERLDGNSPQVLAVRQAPAADGAASAMVWRPTNAPEASSRTDDIWFSDPQTGWAVNSDGNILHTREGGDYWVVQHSAPGSYLRCVAFADQQTGWVGALSGNPRLLGTTDGGATWSGVALPSGAPVAICGLSVVDSQTVFAAGTNRPTDVPRMMKTIDGGTTWTTWDMSSHASVLIDVYFTSATHGWVVGGKSTVPNQTTRTYLKPVVLETSDGGLTWVNRVANLADQFPEGEWGWKIQFLGNGTGFVSLENFTAGAILRTDDWGQTWRRLPINDPQGNANLEGVGFIDGQTGWVGGWGSEDFSTGYSSATTDGGTTWSNANETGQFINRFRFFGNPVTVGYASGLTVYKYSSSPRPAPPPAAQAAPRALLSQGVMRASTLPLGINVDVPAGTARLTVRMWDRFGTDFGVLLDEFNPRPGHRVVAWDGHDSNGRELPPGGYILRAIADQTVASTILDVRKPTVPVNVRAIARASQSRALPARRTIAQLLSAADHDIEWLKEALQLAIQLELFTLPPYLTARWTIKNMNTDAVARSIREVREEEMNHFGLACNMLVAIGGTPVLAHPAVVPKYPGPMPGGVRPSVTVGLKRLSREQSAVFMDVEYPQGGPIALAGTTTYNSIGAFYAAIWRAFEVLNPPLNDTRQFAGPPDIFKVTTLAEVKRAIQLINMQGEGSEASPYEKPGDLAHYYRFAEIYHGKKLVQDSVTGRWTFTGADVPLPDVHPMADMPEGGYLQADVPDQDVWNRITLFDGHYSNMLRLLERAWTHGNATDVGLAVSEMVAMGSIGRSLVQAPKPDGTGTYGPCFRYVA